MSISPSRFTKAPGAGVEPTPTGSEPAVLPLDDPGMRRADIPVCRTVAREGLEPSRPEARPSEDRVSADSTIWLSSTLGGIRTRDLRIESPAATPQAPRGHGARSQESGVRDQKSAPLNPDSWFLTPGQCVGQELNLHSPKAGGLQPLGLADAAMPTRG